MRGLDGRTYIVTGAASGIGLATADRLLDEGSEVVGADLVPIPPDRFRRDRIGGSSKASTWRTRARSSRLVRAAVAFGGAVDGLVNAAGVAGGGPVHMLPAEEWARVISVNLTGTYLTAKHVIGQMLRQPRHGRRPARLGGDAGQYRGARGDGGRAASYSASKGGVVLLTKNMAIDYAGRGIRVNAVCPGFIETPMTASVFGPGMEAALADIVHEHKLGRRMGRPEEIAAGGGLPLVRRRILRHRPSPCRSTAATRRVVTTASPTCWGCPGRNDPDRFDKRSLRRDT